MKNKKVYAVIGWDQFFKLFKTLALAKKYLASWGKVIKYEGAWYAGYNIATGEYNAFIKECTVYAEVGENQAVI